MGKLVDEHQMSFLKGMQILDVAMLANDLVESMVKQKTPGILYELDTEKAYDNVIWMSFLNF